MEKSKGTLRKSAMPKDQGDVVKIRKRGKAPRDVRSILCISHTAQFCGYYIPSPRTEKKAEGRQNSTDPLLFRNAITDNHMSLLYLVNGESANCFG